MIKIIFNIAFVLGALAIIWIGKIFLGTNTLGLAVTVLIGIVYAIGAWELLRFRRITNSLDTALSELTEPIDDLYQWLLKLNPRLQNAVRLRVEGERNALPAPLVTPYLVGLLVMLGLLGTFVGMVDTLKGAVVALEGTTELEAIRAGLAAPIEGLGLAFGTSVAGVAASAMLGLLSVISRRERFQTSHLLDTKVGNELRHFSTNYQQQQVFKAIQDQAKAMPEVADKLTNLAENIEKMADGFNTKLLSSQQEFQETVVKIHNELNDSVDQSLKASLVDSAQLISSSIAPMAEQTMATLNDNALQTHTALSDLGQKQLDTFNDAIKNNQTKLKESVEQSLAQQDDSSKATVKSLNDAVSNATQQLHERTEALLASYTNTSEQWVELQGKQAEQLGVTIREELNQLREGESKRGDAAVARLSELETAVTSHLETLGKALEEPMTRLIETASQTPKAAADVIEKLRGEMTKNLERDNDLLSERTRLMEQLDSLSKTLEESSLGQRQSIDTLIERSAETLTQVGARFSDRLEGESSKLAGVVEHFSSSSAEMASLGDAFQTAVTLFNDSNNQLIENLTRIESSLEQSNNRSDEQLAYYVAQAREIIDHNLLSHQQIISALHAKQPQQLTVDGVS